MGTLLSASAACASPAKDPIEAAVATGADTASGSHDTAPDTDTSAGTAYGLDGLDALGARNLVLIHVDTLRADHLAPYGYSRNTTPILNALGGLVVHDAFAAASWTLPSTTSMLSGLGVEHHGVTHVGADHAPVAALTGATLATHLQALGFATFAGVGNEALLTVDGVTAGFDEVTDPTTNGGSRRMAGLVGGGLDWLDSLPSGQRFFLYVQPMDAHAPYEPLDSLGTWTNLDDLSFPVEGQTTEEEQHDAYAIAYDNAADDAERARIQQALVDVYDETLLELDEAIGVLLTQLEARHLLDDTLIVFAADHGETLTDDAEDPLLFGHGGTVRPELVRVPLLFFHPRLAPSSEKCLAANVDFAPTMVQALGMPPMDDIDGVPLQESCRDFVFASTFLNNTDQVVADEEMVTDGHSMIRVDCGDEDIYRYLLDTDPTGQNAVDRSAVPNVARLEEMLLGFHTDLTAATGASACTLVLDDPTDDTADDTAGDTAADTADDTPSAPTDDTASAPTADTAADTSTTGDTAAPGDGGPGTGVGSAPPG